ncbi:ester cyclase [Halorubrum xinjiangense]|uniref:ester cyclase n=1 Tax=Halorubrum xinjiangense TaxID=261291 RepID=UPI003C6FFAA1
MSDDTLEERKQLVREGVEAINDGDAERLTELIADDAVIHGQGGRDVSGVNRVVSATVDTDAFPDSHLEIEEMVAEGDTVVVRMTFTGTHEGDMHGVPPTGEAIEIRVMSMYRIEDGQLAEGWFVEDDADTLRQLGLWQELTE